MADHRYTGIAVPGSRTRRAGGLPASAVARLYTVVLPVPDWQVPTADPVSHTMGSAVSRYVAQRVPTAPLEHAATTGIPVEVHGIFPYHLARVMRGAILISSGAHPDSGKQHNVIRPSWFLVPRRDGIGPRLIAAVPPGRDYVLHYASMIGHYLAHLVPAPGRQPRVFRYPDAERLVATWTSLGEFVRPGDRVLCGYVDQLVPVLMARGARLVGHSASVYYTATRLTFGNETQVCALGVRFSFWGCIAGRLAAALRDRAVREVIYVGKLGAVTAPDDVYGRVFVPSSYVQVRCAGGKVCARVLSRAESPDNGFLKRFPELESGPHVSVGTVLEEGRELHAYATALHAATVDNEISNIAIALAGRDSRRAAKFSAVHFATDYLADPERSEDRGEFDLTNNRDPRAREHKMAMLGEIASRLSGYYDELHSHSEDLYEGKCAHDALD